MIWANLGDAEVGLSKTKTGAEQTDALNKGLDAFKKTLELKPDDAGVHNNYALALAQAKKLDEPRLTRQGRPTGSSERRQILLQPGRSAGE